MFKSFKKVISTLAAVAILATSASAFAVTFPDVDESASYAPSVDILTNLGVVDGDDNGKFNPDNTVTRAEFTKMVVEAIGEGAAAASSSWTKFTDAQTHWAAGYIETGVSKGFINGYDDFTFGPDDQVTYEQAVKMLVAAIGYTTYAEMAGSYPGGYLSYGSSLKIINGVNGVTNTTALTRAQCAVLIANTLKAPICAVVGTVPNYGTGEMVPDWQPQNGDKYDFKSLLTEEHNASLVRGRVETVVKTDDQVIFRVEASDNYEGKEVVATQADKTAEIGGTAVLPRLTANVGTTDAESMRFVYAEAIAQLDEATGEYTLVSITPYGAPRIVEFSESDVDGTVAWTGTGDTIDVKPEGTKTAKTYTISDTAKFMINDSDDKVGGTVDYSDVETVINAGNERTVVTLIKQTDIASTSISGTDYDVVMATNYGVYEIKEAKAKDDTVSVKVVPAAGGSQKTITWSLDEDDTTKNISLFKDGAEIEYTDLKKGDIALVQAQYNSPVDTMAWANIYVSDETATGVVSTKSNSKRTAVIDDKTYQFATNISSAIEAGREYTLKLDALGVVAKYEAGVSIANIGFVNEIYTERSKIYVDIVTSDGVLETYEAKDRATAVAMKSAITNADVDTFVAGDATDYEVAKASGTAVSTLKRRVFEYQVSGGKIRLPGTLATGSNTQPYYGEVAANTGMTFDADLSMLAGNLISDATTKVVSIEDLLGGKNSVSAYTVSSLEDDGSYGAMVYDQNANTAVCGLVFVTSGISSLSASSSLAVVVSSGVQMKAEDGTPVQQLIVAQDGKENVEVLIDDTTATIVEGTIIMYKTNADGYVETSTDLKEIFVPATEAGKRTYKKAYNDIAGATNYFAEIADANSNSFIVGGNGTGEGRAEQYTIDIDGDNTSMPSQAAFDKVEIFYAPVYSSTESALRILTTVSSGDTTISTALKSFVIGTDNVYTYSFGQDDDEGERVTLGGVEMEIGAYGDSTTGLYVSGMSKIDWSTNSNAGDSKDYTPAIAFVRVINDIVTDVVYYVAD